MTSVPLEDYEGLLETLEILADQDLAKSIEQGLADAAAGRLVSHEDVWDDVDPHLRATRSFAPQSGTSEFCGASFWGGVQTRSLARVWRASTARWTLDPAAMDMPDEQKEATSRRALSPADARDMVRVRAPRGVRSASSTPSASGTCARICRSRSTTSPRSCAGCAGTAGGRDSSSRPGYAVERHSGGRAAAHRRQPQPRQLRGRGNGAASEGGHARGTRPIRVASLGCPSRASYPSTSSRSSKSRHCRNSARRVRRKTTRTSL